MAKFPQALGFELPKVPKKSSSAGGEEQLSAPLKAARAASFARVIGLDFLLGDVVGRVHALDFGAFNANDKLQPLHVVVGLSFFYLVCGLSRRSTLTEAQTSTYHACRAIYESGVWQCCRFSFVCLFLYLPR